MTVHCLGGCFLCMKIRHARPESRTDRLCALWISLGHKPMVGRGVLNSMLGPTQEQSLLRPGVLRDSPHCGPINAGPCLNHAWLR